MSIKKKLKLFRLSSLLYAAALLPALICENAFADQPASFVRSIEVSAGQASEDPKLGQIKTIELKGEVRQPIVLGEITEFKIDQPRYAITGLIRYSNVPGTGFLEMWNYFPGGGQYFSRALGTEQMAPVAGNSDWRRFTLPFYMDGAATKMSPERLVLDLVLPQGGTVSLAQIELHQFTADQNPLTAFVGGWWKPESANIYYQILAPVFFIWSIVVSTLAYRGKSRAFVIGSLKASAVFGLVLLGTLIFGYLTVQPLHILLPLGIGAAIFLSPSLFHLSSLNKRYAQIEERKMAAYDLRV